MLQEKHIGEDIWQRVFARANEHYSRFIATQLPGAV
jgi:hypothetical protein